MIAYYAAVLFGLSVAVTVTSPLWAKPEESFARLVTALLVLPIWGRVFGWW